MGLGQRLLWNAARIARRVAVARTLSDEPGHWLDVRLDGAVPERTQEGFGDASLGLLDLLRCLAAVREDPRFDGVLVRISGSFGSFSRAASLARALGEIRSAGRRVVVFATGLAADQYWIAAAADRIYLPESGELQLVGLSVERFYLRGFLEQIGARPDVVQIGRYKSAGEMFTRDAMSDAEREQIEAWQDDLFDEWVGAIAAGRGLERTRVEALIDAGPYPARDALEAGLIDGLAYADELDDRLGEICLGIDARGRDSARRPRLVDALAYHVGWAGDPGPERVFADRPRIVQLLAIGGVARGGAARGISPEGTGALLDALREEPSVRGVLLRVESGGGDALASDLLHRKVARLVREKPVVVSMGDVVASGGYYLAAAADALHAEAGTLTGSIGVVGGKLDLSGLYEKLGVAKDGVKRGARADLYSESHGFTADERAAVRRGMSAAYATFVDRVARGRSLAPAEVEAAAQGRILSGRRAHALGLLDALDGPLEALADLIARAGFGPRERLPLLTLPRPSVLSAWLSQWLGGAGRFGARRR